MGKYLVARIFSHIFVLSNNAASVYGLKTKKMNWFKKTAVVEKNSLQIKVGYDKKIRKENAELVVKWENAMDAFISNPTPTTFSNAVRCEPAHFESRQICPNFVNPIGEILIENLTLHQCQTFFKEQCLGCLKKVHEFIGTCQKFTIVIAHEKALMEAEEKTLMEAEEKTENITNGLFLWPFYSVAEFNPYSNPKPIKATFECCIVKNILYINTPEWFGSVDSMAMAIRSIEKSVAERLAYLESLESLEI